MPTTPIYALRYPAATDPADVPLDLQELALDAEAKLAPARVTSLPGSPFDGQEVFYAADAANGVLWHLRYRAAASGSYKWEFVGGPPMNAVVLADEGTASGSLTDLTTNGPSITMPLAGDYVFDFGAYAYMTGTAPQGVIIAVSINGGAPAAGTDISHAWTAISIQNQIFKRTRINVGTAGHTARLRYSATGGATGRFSNRYIFATPVRVG